jgi:hypothetical protein
MALKSVNIVSSPYFFVVTHNLVIVVCLGGSQILGHATVFSKETKLYSTP